jgi:hypothetical protein
MMASADADSVGHIELAESPQDAVDLL